jgi:hypothetical protein
MHVQVMDRHAGVLTHVEGEPVAALEQPLAVGDLLRHGDHARHGGAVPGVHVARVGDVLLRDDQDVDGRARVDVADREHQLVVVQLRHVHGARGHPAEQAVVAHLVTSPSCGCGCQPSLGHPLPPVA